MLSGFFKRLMMARQIHFLEGDIAIMDMEAIIMTSNNYLTLREELKDKASENSYDILYDSGKKAAKELADKFYEKYKVKGFEAINLWRNILELNGLCKVIAFDTKEGGKAVIQLKSTLAKAYTDRTKNKEAVDEYLAGLICGITNSVYFREDLIVKEIKCMAMGNDHCEFIVQPKI